MRRTLFDRSVEVHDDWEERSVYRYFLPLAPTVTGRADEDFHPDEFQSNLVVIREPLDGRSLADCAQKHRQAMEAELASAALMREGRTEVAERPAFELQYVVSLPSPIPLLVQWHLIVPWDEHCYFFAATAPKVRFDTDRARFLELIRSMR